MHCKSLRTAEHEQMNKVIGTNLRFLRLLNRLSQQKLADKLHLKFQQIQKYENGVNQVCAYRLLKLSEILKAPLEAFFDKDYISKMHQLNKITYEDGSVPVGKKFFDIYARQKTLTKQYDEAVLQDQLKGLNG
jgi:transcriptional regulator with XRE-family HTH domain